MEIVFLPNFVFGQLGLRKREHLNRCLSAGLVLLAVPLLRYLPHLCLMQWALHRPCPGCGITTGLRSVLALHFDKAWRANPASLAIAALLAYQVAVQPLGIVLPERWSGRIGFVARQISRVSVAALFTVWIERLI